MNLSRLIGARCLAAVALLCGPALAAAAADGVAGSPEAAAMSADGMFVKKAAAGGRAEVALARLAQERSQDEDVKAFAARMEKDHGAANAQLERLAAESGLAAPRAPDPRHQQVQARLAALKGEEFDAAYGKAMREDHEKTIALFERQARDGKVPALRDFAARTLPTLEAHHEMAMDLPGKQ